MKGRHYLLVVACAVMALTSRPAAAIQLLDVLFLSDGSSVTGVIMEEEPGRALVLENEDGELLEYRFKDIERIEKMFVDEQPIIQNRDVVYLKDGVVFRGMIVGRVPEKAIRLELENGQLLDFDFNEIFKIGKEQVATGVVRKAVIKPKKAEKQEVEIKIQIAMNQLQLKQDKLKQGADAGAVEGLQDEVDRLKSEIEQLEEQQEVVEAEAAEEEERFAAVESELGEYRDQLLGAAAELEQRIAVCESPQVKERLEAKFEELQSSIEEVLQRAEVVALVEQPDPRIEEIELQNKTTDAIALAQQRLWKDPEYADRWETLVAELPYEERRAVYRELRQGFPGNKMLWNAIPFAYLGSLRQQDYVGAAIGISVNVAGIAVLLLNDSAAYDRATFNMIADIGIGVLVGAWIFGILEPINFSFSSNKKLREALELTRKEDGSTGQQVAQVERGYVFPSAPAEPRLRLTLVRFAY